MRRNKLIITALALALILPGCSLLKKREVDLNKSSFSHKIESKSTIDSVVKKTDKTVIIERERVDTSAWTPSKKITTKTPITREELVAGLTLVEDSLVSVKVTLDTASQKLTTEVNVKPQKVGLKFDRQKETYTNKTEETAKTTEKQNKESTEAKSKVKKTIAEPQGVAWWWVLIVAVVVTIIIGGIKFAAKYVKKAPG